MSSMLQKIALVSMMALAAGCDTGDGGGVAEVTSESGGSSGVAGTVVKGPISGATITVYDENGEAIPVSAAATSNADGSYSVTFTPAATDAGIAGPLLIEADASGATATCDRNAADTDNDCRTATGTWVAFGETYTLPDPFILRGVIDAIPDDATIITVNISPASDLAAELALAGGTTLTEAGVAKANNQVLGLIGTLTGINLSDLKLYRIHVMDLGNIDTTNAGAPAAAISAFASAMHDLVEDQDFDNVGQAIQFLKDNVTDDPGGSGNLSASGNTLAALARALASSIATVNQLLVAAGVDIPEVNDAAINANSNANLFAGFGDNPVLIAPPPVAGSTNELDLTRLFVNKLADIIKRTVAITGAAGFGATGEGATEMFADELQAVESLSSEEATQAFQQLEAALILAEAELAPGASDSDETDEDGDGVTGTITKSADGNTVTVTGTSTVTNSTTGITVTIEIGEGVRTDTGATGAFSATDIVMTTSQTEGDVTTVLQTFTGDLDTTFVDEGAGIGLGLDTLDFTGDISAQTAGTTFGASISLTDIEGTAEGSELAFPTGQYDAVLTFSGAAEGDLTVRMAGTIRAEMQNFWVTIAQDTIAGTVTRVDTQDTDTLTDGTVTLTLVLDLTDTIESSGSLVSGTFTVNNIETATLDDNGTVFYSDGSIQSLPARIF